MNTILKRDTILRDQPSFAQQTTLWPIMTDGISSSTTSWKIKRKITDKRKIFEGHLLRVYIIVDCFFSVDLFCLNHWGQIIKLRYARIVRTIRCVSVASNYELYTKYAEIRARHTHTRTHADAIKKILHLERVNVATQRAYTHIYNQYSVRCVYAHYIHTSQQQYTDQQRQSSNSNNPFRCNAFTF